MYLLSEEMRNELLKTFRYARDRALKNRDEDSANYYWGLVEYLQGLSKANKKVPKNSNHVQLPSKRLSLKEISDLLKADTSLSPHEKFELYYEEREKIKEDKNSFTLNEMLDSAGIDRSKNSK